MGWKKRSRSFKDFLAILFVHLLLLKHEKMIWTWCKGRDNFTTIECCWWLHEMLESHFSFRKLAPKIFLSAPTGIKRKKKQFRAEITSTTNNNHLSSFQQKQINLNAKLISITKGQTRFELKNFYSVNIKNYPIHLPPSFFFFFLFYIISLKFCDYSIVGAQYPCRN